ncbi:MAG: HEAT repeat domain-containing protein [Spirochaetales bacterium]|nr:HEAT repeat domain-containing protein [Spirochaetales bacterium]
MKVRNIMITAVCFCLVTGILSGDDNGGAGESGSGKKEKSVIDEWRDTLLYGISDEILKVIESIEDARLTSLNPELVAVCAESVDTDVRKAILYYFVDISYRGAESVALALLAESDDLDNKLVIALLDYCAAINAPGLADMIESFVTHSDDMIATTAIIAIGTMGDRSKAEYLIERFKDDEYPEKRKSTIIRVLGTLKTEAAVPMLLDIVEDTYSEKMWRMYACEALGNIGDEEAIPVLKKAFSENDALLKAYSASALASFDLEDVIDLLIQGLKDSNAKVRLHCARALASKDAGKAVDILIYKVKKDPDPSVREAAVTSLGVIGSGKCYSFLRDVYLKPNENLSLRETCLKTLLEHDVDGVLSSIMKLLERDWSNRASETKAFQMTARVCSTKKAKQLKPVYAKLITHPLDAIRVYGIRGIAANNLKELRSVIEKLSKEDPVYVVRKEALTALEML